MAKQKIIIFLTYSLLMVLFLPMLQNFFGFLEVVELSGVSKEEEQPDWYWDKWFNGDYQKQMTAFHRTHFGFREALIRTNNDRVYAWYNESTNNELVIGKDNYLFGKEYIDEYLGRDYIGRAELKNKIDYLKVISDRCKERGKTFLLVLAPSKAYYYPEYFPTNYQKKDSTNFAVFLSEAKAQRLDVFDVNSWFSELKSTSAYPLFPKGGTHWSNYGVSVFIDSLLRKLEGNIGKDLPELVIDSLWLSDSLLSPDNDLELVLNLSHPIKSPPHAYVNGHYVKRGKYRPKVITIGDSFWGTFQFKDYLPKDCFSNSSRYWYYNHTVFPGGHRNVAKNLYELDNSDVVMMVVATCNIPHFAWGALSGLRNHLSLPDDVLLQQVVDEIKANEGWYTGIKNKAIEYEIPLDTVLYRDARYIMNKRRSK